MMPSKLLLILFLLFIHLYAISHAFASKSSPLAAVIGHHQITQAQVNTFIEDSMMEDISKIVLFSKSKSYHEYKNNKKKWIEQHYEQGLKTIAYYIMVAEQAEKESDENGHVFFQLSIEEYNLALKKVEDRALRPILDKRNQGVADARSFFGEQLIQASYPHKSNISAQQVFWRWYESKGKRIKQDYRRKKINQWQIYKASQNPLNVTHNEFNEALEIMPVFNQSKKEIQKKLLGKIISPTQLNSLFEQNPLLPVAIKSIDNIDFSSQSLCQILKASNSQQKNNAIKEQLIFHVYALLNKELLTKIFLYEEKILTFNDKYPRINDVEKLIHRLKVTKKMSNTRNYQDDMLGFLYQLTLAYKQDKAIRKNTRKKNRKKILHRYSQAYFNIRNEIVSHIKNTQNFCTKTFKGLNFEQYIAKINRLYSHKSFPKQSKTSYTNAFLDMALWVNQFEIKKWSLSYAEPLKIRFVSPYSKQGIKQIKHYIKQQNLIKNLRAYRDDLRNYYMASIEIYIHQKKLISNQAIDFVFD